MVWLESPKSQLSKTFFGLKIRLLLRKLWAKTSLYVFAAFDQLFIVFYIFDTFDIHSITALRCIWSIFDIFNMLYYTQYLKCVCMFPCSASSTYIELQPLGVFDLSSTSSTYIALQPLSEFDLSSTSSTLLWSLVLIYQYLAPLTPPTSKSHSIYNVDSNSKSSNYMKIRFKGLIYFELQQSSN